MIRFDYRDDTDASAMIVMINGVLFGSAIGKANFVTMLVKFVSAVEMLIISLFLIIYLIGPLQVFECFFVYIINSIVCIINNIS